MLWRLWVVSICTAADLNLLVKWESALCNEWVRIQQNSRSICFLSFLCNITSCYTLWALQRNVSSPPSSLCRSVRRALIQRKKSRLDALRQSSALRYVRVNDFSHFFYFFFASFQLISEGVQRAHNIFLLIRRDYFVISRARNEEIAIVSSSCTVASVLLLSSLLLILISRPKGRRGDDIWKSSISWLSRELERVIGMCFCVLICGLRCWLNNLWLHRELCARMGKRREHNSDEE